MVERTEAPWFNIEKDEFVSVDAEAIWATRMMFTCMYGANYWFLGHIVFPVPILTFPFHLPRVIVSPDEVWYVRFANVSGDAFKVFEVSIVCTDYIFLAFQALVVFFFLIVGFAFRPNKGNLAGCGTKPGKKTTVLGRAEHATGCSIHFHFSGGTAIHIRRCPAETEFLGLNETRKPSKLDQQVRPAAPVR